MIGAGYHGFLVGMLLVLLRLMVRLVERRRLLGDCDWGSGFRTVIAPKTLWRRGHSMLLCWCSRRITGPPRPHRGLPLGKIGVIVRATLEKCIETMAVHAVRAGVTHEITETLIVLTVAVGTRMVGVVAGDDHALIRALGGELVGHWAGVVVAV